MPELITRTSGADHIGREVTYSDEDVPHQIRIHVGSDSSTRCRISCNCGAGPVNQQWVVPIEETWAAWESLDHRPAMDAIA